MTTVAAPKARTTNEVASLFLIQALERTQKDMQRWIAQAQESEASALDFIDDVCNLGSVFFQMSTSQFNWITRMYSTERHFRGHRPTLVVVYEGKEVGMLDGWEKSGRAQFILDPAFVQTYLGVDASLLQQARAATEAKYGVDDDGPVNKWMLSLASRTA